MPLQVRQKIHTAFPIGGYIPKIGDNVPKEKILTFNKNHWH